MVIKAEDMSEPHLGHGYMEEASWVINCGAAAILMLNFDKGGSFVGWLVARSVWGREATCARA